MSVLHQTPASPYGAADRERFACSVQSGDAFQEPAEVVAIDLWLFRWSSDRRRYVRPQNCQALLIGRRPLIGGGVSGGERSVESAARPSDAPGGGAPHEPDGSCPPVHVVMLVVAGFAHRSGCSRRRGSELHSTTRPRASPTSGARSSRASRIGARPTRSPRPAPRETSVPGGTRSASCHRTSTSQ